MESNQRSSFTREFSFLIVLFAGIGWLIFNYQVLFGPLIISGLISYLLYPLATWISLHTRIDRRKTVAIVYVVFLVLLILGIVYLFPVVVNQARMLDSQILRFTEEAEVLQDTFEKATGFKLPLELYLAEFDDDLGQLFQPERAFRIIRSATTNVVWVIVIIITSFHLLRDWEKLREWMFGLLSDKLESEYRQLHQEIKKVWQSYLRGQLVIMFFIGLFSGVGAAALGIRSALLLGLLAGALALIPNLGPAIATAIAAIVAWVQGSSYLELSNLSVTLLVVVIFVIVQGIEGFWLTPGS